MSGCDSSLKQKQTVIGPLSKKKELQLCDYSWVCVVNPPVGSAVCFSFRVLLEAMLLLPYSWGCAALKERQQRGLAFSPCQIMDKTKALISLMPTLTSSPKVSTCWSQTDYHVCICSIFAFQCCLLAWLHRKVFKANITNVAWNSFNPDISLLNSFCSLM